MPEVEKINPYHDDSRSKDAQVRSMFDAIAPAYDFMNRAMTFGLDRLWLRRLIAVARSAAPTDIIDLATGTGDVALALARALPQTHLTGLDLSEGMLEKARQKSAAAALDKRITFVCGDCLDTRLPDACADLITIAYGVRNFADIAAGYREMHRLLRPGGTLAVLELSRPVSPLVTPFYNAYTRLLIPAAGRIMSHDCRAYSYLPESIAAAPQRQAMTAIMAAAGFRDTTFRAMTMGVCTLYTARR
ncbi:MAG: bifunctional demethylmenaquinone methyltransferase/2-methoxy-6-polyprenyl-1,4-benzoquinol methylase UbiE [Muribaculaceae bacterium]|nr:bifunctional demethylmenaquinone methyltransferase/2-methoxy-6-polyprenyl-1,4-benzoquinol methylase UbiE [Muribaculaceae bacterium]